MTQSTYTPGVCNINSAEIAQRRRMGQVGAVLFVIGLVSLLITGVTRYDRLVLFVPALVAASGYVQARSHFCVAYAAAGKQRASDDQATTQAVADMAARRADRQRALKLNLQSAAWAGLATAVVMLIP